MYIFYIRYAARASSVDHVTYRILRIIRPWAMHFTVSLKGVGVQYDVKQCSTTRMHL